MAKSASEGGTGVSFWDNSSLPDTPSAARLAPMKKNRKNMIAIQTAVFLTVIVDALLYQKFTTQPTKQVSCLKS
jgi:hypothetical protein